MRAEITQIKILVVDDMPVMRRIIVNLLLEIGFRNVQQAEDGKSALTKLTSGEFDLLITDWNMPGMSGIDLVKAVRHDAKTKKMPVLMVTAEATRDSITTAAQAGINGYIVKPFSAATLKEKIEKILVRHLAEQA